MVQNAPSFYRVVRLSVLILLLPVVLLLWAPNMMITAVMHDIAVPLDTGWRVLQGQVPNRDFHEPVGPLYPWIEALGLWVGGGTGKSVVYAEALGCLFLAPALVWTACSRLTLWPAVIVVCTVLSIPMAPREGDADYSVFSHLADYNRFSWVCLCLLTLLVLLPHHTPSRRTQWIDGVLQSFAFASLILLKLPMALLGAALLGLAPIFSQALALQRLNGWISALVGLGLAALLCAILGSIPGYAADLMMAVQAAHDSQEGFRWGRLLFNSVINIPTLLVLGATLWLCLPLPGHRYRLRMAVLPTVCAIILSIQNPDSAIPILAIIAVCLYEHARRNAGAVSSLYPSDPTSHQNILTVRRLAFAVLVALLPASQTLTTNWISMVFAGGTGFPGFGVPMIQAPTSPLHSVTTRANADPGAQYIPGIPLPPLTADPKIDPTRLTRSNLARAWTDIYNSMRPFVTPNSRIWTVGFSNPFSLAFRAKDPVGANTWWDAGRTYTQAPNTHPDLNFLLCHTDIVVEYRSLRIDDQPALRTMVEPLLIHQFQIRAQTPWANIWTRKINCPAT